MATYDPQDVRLVFGAILVGGYGDGLVNVTHDDEGTKAFVGTAGEAAFVVSRKKSGKFTFKLAATSNINAALTVHYQAGNPAVPAGLISKSTGGAHVAPAAKLARMPDIDYSAEMPQAEWVIIAPQLDDSLLGAPPELLERLLAA